MVLLHLLSSLAGRNKWRLSVAHLNHCLRGRSSDADERLVRRTAERLGVRFVSERVDVRHVAKAQKLSLEMAARNARHPFLARTARRLRVSTIALAHHADDQLELFFLRLFRGSGGEGLGGMKWTNPSPADPRIQLCRPLLDQPKAALQAFAAANKIKFREDATNALFDFKRNRIRHELLPLLRKHYEPGLARTIPRLMEIIGAESEFVTSAARDWLSAATPKIDFLKLPLALQRRCIQLQLLRFEIAPTFELVEQLRSKPNCPVNIPNDARSVLCDSSGKLTLAEMSEIGFERKGRKQLLFLERGQAFFAGARFHWQVRRGKLPPKHTKTPEKEVFDAEKLGPKAILRHWRPGDRFQPIGMATAVKLQDLFVNAKVPKSQRHRLIIGTTGSGDIFWVEGLRISEKFKLEKTTRVSLIWQWRRG